MPAATQTASPATTSPAAALRALYPGAARAFLDRNFDATQAAVDEALALLAASPVLPGQPDELAGQRRKWDMLRVTLQTTVYGQPAARGSASKRFSGLRQLMPQALVASMHARSVQLFTPHALKPSSAFLPPQVLVNLVLAALKLDCPQGARSIAEDWLAAQHAEPLDADSVREYEKVVQVYCIHVLPRLAEWDLAADHLHTNHMLPDDARRHLLKSLRAARAAADAQPPQTPPPPPATPTASSSRASTPTSDSTVTPQRVASPTPSTSSAETSSTRTARPAARNGLAVTSLARRPSTPPQEHASTPAAPPTPSASSQLTITPQRARLSRLTSPPPSSTSRASSRRPTRPQTAGEILELVRTTLAPHIARIVSSRIALFFLFVLFPVLAGLLRFRWARRRTRATAPSIAGVFPADPAQLARERLKGAGANWWTGALRAVVDTVRMASGGLT